jgi:alkylation response protein AidB-like acyl-CoA dehydrogenase
MLTPVSGIFLSLTDEQELLLEAARGTLARQPTLERARDALDGAPRPLLWDLAVDAGWPGLLSSEDVDGAGLGAYEAMLVLEACGERVADAGLLGHLPAVALIENTDSELRGRLASGEKRAALVIDGVTPALDAAGADTLVVVSGTAARLVSAADASITEQSAYDATRSLARVSVDAGAGIALDVAPDRVRDGVDLQRALLAADSVGAAAACLAMATEYAIDRHAFGRAIGSYQAVKHKLVEMMRRIENARSLLVEAGRAWDGDRAEFALLANAARVVAADALDYCAAENIFIHGGVGATWEHDAQLYYRRAELSRRLAGGAEAAADEVAGELLARAFTKS